MIPNVSRGGRVYGLLRYLVSVDPQNANLHVDPRLVAGESAVMTLCAGRPLSLGDARELARHLDQPRLRSGTRVTVPRLDKRGEVCAERKDAHVWHCSLSLHPGRPFQTSSGRRCASSSSRRWGSPLTRLKLIVAGWPSGTATPPAAMTTRTSWSTWSPKMAARRRCITTGLARSGRAGSSKSSSVCAGSKRALARPAAGESIPASEWLIRAVSAITVPMGANRNADRQTLERIVRACATASHTESEFLTALREQGVRVRARYAHGGRTAVVGYSVRLPGPEQGARRSIWFGGGRLARDLTPPPCASAGSRIPASGRRR
jgi:hypothetical protein